jgi:hypothetical protein
VSLVSLVARFEGNADSVSDFDLTTVAETMKREAPGMVTYPSSRLQ